MKAQKFKIGNSVQYILNNRVICQGIIEDISTSDKDKKYVCKKEDGTFFYSEDKYLRLHPDFIETQSTGFCEKYGIVSFEILNDGITMRYYKCYPSYLREQRRTYKHLVDLTDLSETITMLHRYNKAGESNK